MNKKLTIILLIILPFFAFGQKEQAKNDELDKLSFMLGHWKWEVNSLLQPGDPKLYQGVGYSHIYFINDSTALMDDHSIDYENGTIYKAITYRTYDPVSKQYLVVWAQANSSNTLKIEGHWEGDVFVEIDKGTDSYGNWTNRMEIYDIQPNSRKAKLKRTYDSGFVVQIMEYTANRIEGE